jgi:high-affinity nickel-transport protein
MVALLAHRIRAVAGQIGGLISAGVSGVFLVLIGVNLVVLIGIVTVFTAMRRGEFDEVELERQLANRGFLNRVLGGATKTVRRPIHTFGIGLLFGLGFYTATATVTVTATATATATATEVTLLVIAGGDAAQSLPWYAILVLPLLFAAGMSLFDSLDGIVMCGPTTGRSWSPSARRSTTSPSPRCPLPSRWSSV